MGFDPINFYNSNSLLIAQIGINSIIATSMFVVLYSGQLSLAAPGFMAIGAYTSVLMDAHWHTPFALNLVAGTVLAGTVGVLVGLPVLRLRGVFLAIATIGFIEALRLGVILNLPITGEGLGLKNETPDPLGGINLVLVAVVVVVFPVVVVALAQVGLVIVFVSSVTAPFLASTRPSTVAPVVTVMLVRARMVPRKLDPVPRVAELPTCQ